GAGPPAGARAPPLGESPQCETARELESEPAILCLREAETALRVGRRRGEDWAHAGAVADDGPGLREPGQLRRPADARQRSPQRPSDSADRERDRHDEPGTEDESHPPHPAARYHDRPLAEHRPRWPR